MCIAENYCFYRNRSLGVTLPILVVLVGALFQEYIYGNSIVPTLVSSGRVSAHFLIPSLFTFHLHNGMCPLRPEKSCCRILKTKLYPGFYNDNFLARSCLCYRVPNRHQRHDGYKTPKKVPHQKCMKLPIQKMFFRDSESLSFLMVEKLEGLLVMVK